MQQQNKTLFLYTFLTIVLCFSEGRLNVCETICCLSPTWWLNNAKLLTTSQIHLYKYQWAVKVPPSWRRSRNSICRLISSPSHRHMYANDASFLRHKVWWWLQALSLSVSHTYTVAHKPVLLYLWGQCWIYSLEVCPMPNVNLTSAWL